MSETRRELEWVEVRADEVVEDDVLANHGSVTESRPFDEEVDGKAHIDRCEWTIRVGEGFATRGPRDRWMVVGRPPRTVWFGEAS